MFDFKANAYGIRGLNCNVSEWGTRSPRITSGDLTESGYVVLGGVGSILGIISSFPMPISRQPWEAFEEVGFRCVRSIKNQGV